MAQTAPDPSKAYKWVALVSSLVCLVFLAAAAIRENVTADWRHYQQSYREILKARATDAASRRALTNASRSRASVGACARCEMMRRNSRGLMPG